MLEHLVILKPFLVLDISELLDRAPGPIMIVFENKRLCLFMLLDEDKATFCRKSVALLVRSLTACALKAVCLRGYLNVGAFAS